MQRFQIATFSQNVYHLSVDLNVRLNRLSSHFVQNSLKVFSSSIIDVVQYATEQSHEGDVNGLDFR